MVIIIAVIALLFASAALSLLSDGLAQKKELKALKRAKTEELQKQEDHFNGIIASYQDSLKLIDLRIDSFDIALGVKDEQLNNTHDEVQLLSGDSLAIVDALQRVFTR
jgi:hypothetical protein